VRAPVQGNGPYWMPSSHPYRVACESRDGECHPPGTISDEEFRAIYECYVARYGRGQSAERLAERGGFGYAEIVALTGKPPKTWQPQEGLL
jgi:hypothetical protein